MILLVQLPSSMRDCSTRPRQCFTSHSHLQRSSMNINDRAEASLLPVLRYVRSSGDSDLITLLLYTIAAISVITYLFLWNTQDKKGNNPTFNDASDDGLQTRDVVDEMAASGFDCIVFYGSQSGNAEDFATRLNQEAKSLYGLKSTVADLEEYSLENLDNITSDKVVIFILATYGEGEPTDNATDFHNWVTTSEQDLSSLNYMIFGLGNSTYEHFNLMSRSTDACLQQLGATKVGARGEGDDGKGTLEEDFMSWKDDSWPLLAEKMGLEKMEAGYTPSYSLTELSHMDSTASAVFRGEPNDKHLAGSIEGPFSSRHPFIAPVLESRELYDSTDRSCVHIEVDISDQTFETGDHIAVWPSNPNSSVNNFLTILGLLEKSCQAVDISALDGASKVPFPSPTTYDTIARYQLEICGPVSRQFLGMLVPFAPNEQSKMRLSELANDKHAFGDRVRAERHNIATLLASISSGLPWTDIPLTVFIEGMPKLQPRYYSISSSSLLSPSRVSMTVAVETAKVAQKPDLFRGVASNYLSAVCNLQSKSVPPCAYDVEGPRGRYGGSQLLVHLRSSTFRLPRNEKLPVILIGPGTGVAPLRAFVQERVQLAKQGEEVGKTVLFFGCRTRKEDLLYETEWQVSQVDRRPLPRS